MSVRRFAGEEDSRSYSPCIWDEMPVWADMLEGDYNLVEENFERLPVTAVDAVIDESDDNVTLSCVATEIDGVFRIGLATDDNEEGWVTSLVPIGEIDTTEGEAAMEFVFRTSSVADNVNGIAMGLVKVIADGSNIVQADDTAEITTLLDFIGFNTLQADGDALRAVYSNAATAAAVALSTTFALTADTWTKAGLRFKNGRLHFYAGDETTAVTELGSVSAEADGVPDGVMLCWVVAAKTGSAATLNFDTDKLRFAQLKQTVASV